MPLSRRLSLRLSLVRASLSLNEAQPPLMDRRLKGRTLVQCGEIRMERKSDEEFCLFVRDEQTGPILFNAKSLRALGINTVEAHQRGYPMKEQSDFGRSSGRPQRRLAATVRIIVGKPRCAAQNPANSNCVEQPIQLTASLFNRDTQMKRLIILPPLGCCIVASAQWLGARRRTCV
jgi:hypothetical protein